MPVALVLTSIGFERSNPLVKGFSPLTPRRKKVIPMDTVAYVAVMVLGIASNLTAAILVEKFKKKGLICCEQDIKELKYI